MSRKKVDLAINNFTRGLITEANPLTYPDNSSLYEENCLINTDGSRQRRLGIDFENNYVGEETEITPSGVPLIPTTYLWRGAGSDRQTNIVVTWQQTSFGGRVLRLYNAEREVISDSPLGLGGIFDGEGGLINPNGDIIIFSDGVAEPTFTTIQGMLLFSIGDEKLYVVEYDQVDDKATLTEQLIASRDLWGVEPVFAVDYRPTNAELVALPDPLAVTNYLYNLSNQGWDVILPTVDNTEEVAWSYIERTTGAYPSNADIVWLSKNSQGLLDVDSFKQSITGTTEAPKGKNIFDIVRRIKHSGIGLDTSSGSITSMASYAGRAFYYITEYTTEFPTPQTPKVGSLIFYTQIVSNKSDLSLCHSQADPTSEESAGVVDSDGGFISIPEMGAIKGMRPLGNSLFVFADNGVWEINGADSYFSATNNNVEKVSNSSCLSGGSIVEWEGSVCFWGEEGILALTPSENGLGYKIFNLTEKTIQKYYDEITPTAKQNVTSVYDQITKQLRWQFGEGFADPSFKDRELVFDITLQAFYPVVHSNGATGPYIISAIPSLTRLEADFDNNVVVGVDDVVVGGQDVIVTTSEIDEGATPSVKYFTYYYDTVATEWFSTFSQYRNIGFVDWFAYDGVGIDAPATLLTGYMTGGDASKYKKVTHLVAHFRLTEDGFINEGNGNLEFRRPSGCFVQAQWEWTNSPAAGRWGTKFQAYRLPRYYGPVDANDDFDYGFTTVTTKNKLRGKGRALSILFESEPGKDMHIYGWNLSVTVNSEE